ncbi:hypothetical protein [Priestia megaterium]|uniref:hypothetical protein n=1 Tax=Priestia megaterium TaxID=1404 RepID=UPI003D04D792
MQEYLNPKVQSLSEVVGEYEVIVGIKTVNFKIKKHYEGYFYHSVSHYYHGPEQVGSYISSRNVFDTKEKAIHGAIDQITAFYEERHENPKDNWQVNEDY